MRRKRKGKGEMKKTEELTIVHIFFFESVFQGSSDKCTPIFISALFKIAKIWKQHKCSSVDEWVKNCGVFTQWNTTQPFYNNFILYKNKSHFYNSMDGPADYYTK